jgi:tight adherence protein B
VLAAAACLVWPWADHGAAARRPPRGGENSGGSLLRRAAQRVRLGRGTVDDGWVADFAEVVAVGLDAGLDLPGAALASARSPGVCARAPGLADRLESAVGAGRAVTTVLQSEPDVGPRARDDLELLVAAWRLAEGAGAGASAVTAAAAASVRERRAAADRTAVVVAGPRASMLLLSALPLAGPAAALLVGIPPGRLYDTAPARILAAVGVLLTVIGWWWARRMLRRAGRPGRTDGGAG